MKRLVRFLGLLLLGTLLVFIAVITNSYIVALCFLPLILGLIVSQLVQVITNRTNLTSQHKLRTSSRIMVALSLITAVPFIVSLIINGGDTPGYLIFAPPIAFVMLLIGIYFFSEARKAEKVAKEIERQNAERAYQRELIEDDMKFQQYLREEERRKRTTIVVCKRQGCPCSTTLYRWEQNGGCPECDYADYKVVGID